MRYLKNMTTGVVFPFHPILKEKRPDLLECDKHGNLTHVAPQPSAPFLFNPITQDMVANSPEMSTKLGWIPVQSAEHAEQVMAELSGSPVPKVPPVTQPQGQGLQQPPTGEADTGAQPDVSHETAPVIELNAEQEAQINTLANAPVSSMNRKTLVKFAHDQFEEQIDETGDTELTLLREQVQVLINNRLNELQGAA